MTAEDSAVFGALLIGSALSKRKSPNSVSIARSASVFSPVRGRTEDASICLLFIEPWRAAIVPRDAVIPLHFASIISLYEAFKGICIEGPKVADIPLVAFFT